MLSGINGVVDEVHSPKHERTHTDEAKVKPRSLPKRGKLGRTRRREWLSEVCCLVAKYRVVVRRSR
jgi:hypothetical protein